jgi:excinuclease UvrABC nuclease subunit
MPIVIRRLDLRALPCCPVQGKHSTIPDFPVLYIIFDDTQVFYVGATKSLYKRWSAHRSDHRMKKILRREDVRVAWITAEIERFGEYEVALMQFLKPTINFFLNSGYHHINTGVKKRVPYQRLVQSNGNGHK